MSNEHNKSYPRQLSFKVTEEQYQAFIRLVHAVPGADAGAMFREAFTRGLRDLKTFYEKIAASTEEAQ